mgnify:FL=1
MMAITELLKLSGSIKTQLIPGTDNYLDKKTYQWSVESFGGSKFQLKFKYDFPEYISVGQPDTMKITFNHSDTWIVPQDSNKASTP